MKKFLITLLSLLLAVTPAMAEESQAAVPTQIIPQTDEMLFMSDAILKAQEALQVIPAECLTRAELVLMSDGSHQWVVSIFDMTNFADAWTIAVDAVSGEVISVDATNIGYFSQVNDRWESARGLRALWSLEDKMLFDMLYTVNPVYGLPMEGDMTHGQALEIALNALEITGAADFQIGYGYMIGLGDGVTNGVWEVYLVQNGELVYKVNLDAVNGDIYLIEPDEEGNG